MTLKSTHSRRESSSLSSTNHAASSEAFIVKLFLSDGVMMETLFTHWVSGTMVEWRGARFMCDSSEGGGEGWCWGWRKHLDINMWRENSCSLINEHTHSWLVCVWPGGSAGVKLTIEQSVRDVWPFHNHITHVIVCRPLVSPPQVAIGPSPWKRSLPYGWNVTQRSLRRDRGGDASCSRCVSTVSLSCCFTLKASPRLLLWSNNRKVESFRVQTQLLDGLLWDSIIIFDTETTVVDRSSCSVHSVVLFLLCYFCCRICCCLTGNVLLHRHWTDCKSFHPPDVTVVNSQSWNSAPCWTQTHISLNTLCVFHMKQKLQQLQNQVLWFLDLFKLSTVQRQVFTGRQMLVTVCVCVCVHGSVYTHDRETVCVCVSWHLVQLL